jgi:tRNA dimethylallyltransferase
MRMVALMPNDRSILHARIAERFDGMLREGLLAEVSALLVRYPGLTPECPAMRSVGYRQAWQHLRGEIDAATLRHKGIVATRQLAKRQMTWMRGLEADLTLDPFDPATPERVHAALLAWWPRAEV